MVGFKSFAKAFIVERRRGAIREIFWKAQGRRAAIPAPNIINGAMTLPRLLMARHEPAVPPVL
jgi:hypothetical protein